jgi:hypothetical protein
MMRPKDNKVKEPEAATIMSVGEVGFEVGVIKTPEGLTPVARLTIFNHF